MKKGVQPPFQIVSNSFDIIVMINMQHDNTAMYNSYLIWSCFSVSLLGNSFTSPRRRSLCSREGYHCIIPVFPRA
jgi:hypothetical protein